MSKHVCACCRHTRGRFEGTRGEEEEGHRQFCSPKFAHAGLSRASEVQPCMLPTCAQRSGALHDEKSVMMQLQITTVELTSKSQSSMPDGAQPSARQVKNATRRCTRKKTTTKMSSSEMPAEMSALENHLTMPPPPPPFSSPAFNGNFFADSVLLRVHHGHDQRQRNKAETISERTTRK